MYDFIFKLSIANHYRILSIHLNITWDPSLYIDRSYGSSRPFLHPIVTGLLQRHPEGQLSRLLLSWTLPLAWSSGPDGITMSPHYWETSFAGSGPWSVSFTNDVGSHSAPCMTLSVRSVCWPWSTDSIDQTTSTAPIQQLVSIVRPSPVEDGKVSREIRVVWQPLLWNLLPDTVTKITSSEIFVNNLKTHLFSTSYNLASALYM